MKWIYCFLVFSQVYACTGERHTNTKSDITQKVAQKNSNAIPVGKKPDALFLSPNKQKLYVANSDDDHVSVIDTKSDKVIGGIKKTWGFSGVPKTNLLALTTYDGRIALIDFEQEEIIRDKEYAYKLGGITADPEGQYLYVVAIEAEKVLKIKTDDLTVVDSYPTEAGPDGIAIAKDGRKLFVSNRDAGTISIIQLTDHTSTTLKTGGKPELINASQDNTIIYVSNFALNTMHVINTNLGTILHNITGLYGPEGANFDKKQQALYISNYNTDEVYEYRNNDYTQFSRKFATGKHPLSIISLHDKLYVSNYTDNSVSVISRN